MHALCVLLVGLSVAGCRGRPELGEDIRNVILLSVDTLNRSALNTYNERAAVLPHLDRFAQGSVRFANAYSTAAWTLPAHASLLTGLYPDRHGAVHLESRLPSELSTLARLLGQRGFETVAFTGGGFLDRKFGYDIGFDRYDAWTRDPQWRPDLTLWQDGRQDSKLFDRAIAYLHSVDAEDPPFFLFLHTFHVHNYFFEEPPSEQDLRLFGCLTDVHACPEAERWSELSQRYEERLRSFDKRFGKLVGALERTGLRDSTLVIVTSDHGEGFDVGAQRIHHGGRLHEDLIRIPFFVTGPHLSRRSVDDAISLVDVMPTILDLLKIPVKDEFDGRSFAASLYLGVPPAFDGRVLYAMEHIFAWVDGIRVGSTPPGDEPRSLAVIQGRHYYIRGDGDEQLYDMERDPAQRRNLADSSPHLAEVRQAADRRAAFPPPPAETMIIDAELRESLRKLGYVP
jgi:arylsulfatase A-like enzyme